jgi:uncharacterized protein (DUF2164 family)
MILADLWLVGLAIFGMFLSGYIFYKKGLDDGRAEIRQEVMRSIFELISDIEDDKKNVTDS